MLTSQICRYDDFKQSWYRKQEAQLHIRDIYAEHSANAFDFVNRKFWEWGAIVQALEERGRLKPGLRGLGFAVGTEPLSAYFAGRRLNILATDLGATDVNQGWVETGQHAAAKDALYYPQLVDHAEFDMHVAFQAADMRTLEGILGSFDFLWSSCAMEHLGSLRAGLDFVLNSARLLKPGGVAVHTTEINIGSNDETLESPDCVIYRNRDIEWLGMQLMEQGFALAQPNFDAGNHEFDRLADTEPYMQSGIPHLKLQIGDHVCTSMLLIVQRPADSRPRQRWLARFGWSR